VRERKVRIKQIDIWTELKRDISNTELKYKKMKENEGSKNKDEKIIVIKLKLKY
jgi:hypothetical protein